MMPVQEKNKLIQDLESQKKKIITKLNRLSNLERPKRNSTVIKRAFKVVDYLIQIRSLNFQKAVIASQPIPKFNKGIAIVGDNTKPEIIELNNGKKHEL